jgi:hypothetical protein
VLAASAVVVASLFVGGSTAAAFHIPGATYVGTHSGGGAVSFTVSPSGLAVRNFRVENYETEFCLVDSLQHVDSAPIVNNAFTGGSTILETRYTGSFPSVQFAQGTFVDDECETGTLTWTARTTASPAGSAECIAAQAPVIDAEAQLAAAQAGASKAAAAVKGAVRRVKNARQTLKRTTRKARKARGTRSARKAVRAKRRAGRGLRVAARKRGREMGDLKRAKAGSAQSEVVLQQLQAAKTAVCGA